VEVVLLSADGRKDMKKLTGTFRDKNTPKSAAMQMNMEDVFIYRLINIST